MTISMSDISRACGVSRQTVGYILNGRGHLFKGETQRKVWRTAERMGYRVNASARAMRTGRSNCIALLLGTFFYMPKELLRAINFAAERRNYHITLTELAHADLSQPASVPKQLKEILADAFLLNWTFGVPADVMALVAETRLPFLCINSNEPPGSVLPDDLQGGRMATEHLLELGHRRISYVSFVPNDIPHYSEHERALGYQQAMTAAGLAPDSQVAPPNLTPRQRIQAVVEMLSRPDRPEAIVAYSSPTAIAVHMAALHCGLDIPRDLSLVTIDDRPHDMTGIAFDTLLLPWDEVAETSLDQLVQRLDHPDQPVQTTRVPYHQLCRGESAVPARRA